MSSDHDQSGEDSTEDDADGAGDDPPEESFEILGENQSEGEDDEDSGEVEDPILSPRSGGPPIPTWEEIHEEMQRIGDANGDEIEEWNDIRAWINSRYGHYDFVREALAREDRKRQRSRQELEDSDSNESDSSDELSRRNRRARDPDAATEEDAGAVADLTTSSSSSGDGELSLCLRFNRGEVLTLSLGDSRRVNIRFSSAQEVNAENQEIRDSRANGASGSVDMTDNEAAGSTSVIDANSGEYKLCDFFLPSEEQGEKLCGSPIVNAPLPYCVEHMQLSGVLERGNVASSSGTSLSKNNAANIVQEEPKPSEQEDKPSS